MDKGIIKITWEKCNEADGYLLYEIIDDAEKLLVTIWNVDITSATIPNCLQGKEHHFQIYCMVRLLKNNYGLISIVFLMVRKRLYMSIRLLNY